MSPNDKVDKVSATFWLSYLFIILFLIFALTIWRVL